MGRSQGSNHHSISFTRAQGFPKYKIGFGRGKLLHLVQVSLPTTNTPIPHPRGLTSCFLLTPGAVSEASERQRQRELESELEKMATALKERSWTLNQRLRDDNAVRAPILSTPYRDVKGTFMLVFFCWPLGSGSGAPVQSVYSRWRCLVV